MDIRNSVKQPSLLFFLAQPIHFPKSKLEIREVFGSQERQLKIFNVTFSGHKIKPQYDFDFVALDLLSVYPEDSGTYTCTARNALGEATSSATVKIAG